jgi:nucleoside-diphosphate-sugar epimerase
MTRVVITGGSGKVGRASTKELLAHGYEVINLDVAPPRETLCRFMRTDFTDYGQVFEALSDIDGGYTGVDAVVHLAAIPGPSNAPNATLFHNNSASSFNVFWAARKAGIKNVIWASSETLQGVPFDTPPPYVPMDEDYPARPESAYSLSKFLDEEMAKQFCRWDSELKMIGLRFSYVKEPTEFAQFREVQANPALQNWNLWSYVDARDCGQAVRLALEYQFTGFDTFVIAAPDTIMIQTNAELLAQYFPDVPLKREIAPHESLLSSDKAKRVLGYQPTYSWREGTIS